MAHTPRAVRDEMQERLRKVVALTPEHSRKAALASVARLVGLPFGRIKALFYGEARRIDAHEADKIRAYYKAAQKLIEARTAYEKSMGDFLRDHPNLAQFVPSALEQDELSDEAEAAASSELAKRRRG